MTASRLVATINRMDRTAIMMIAASRDTKMSITTISTMTKEVPRTAMRTFHLFPFPILC